MSATSLGPVTTGSRTRSLAVVAIAAATALGLVFFMISSVTGAAWSDTTDNNDNAWATGTVALTDGDQGIAMFRVADDGLMVPGTELTNSITVENESDVPLDVKLYAANYSSTSVVEDSLGAELNVKIGTTFGGADVYDGTLAGLDDHEDFSSGTAESITLAADGTQTYYFSVELDPDTPPSLQGANAGIDFIWEGQTQ